MLRRVFQCALRLVRETWRKVSLWPCDVILPWRRRWRLTQPLSRWQNCLKKSTTACTESTRHYTVSQRNVTLFIFVISLSYFIWFCYFFGRNITQEIWNKHPDTARFTYEKWCDCLCICVFLPRIGKIGCHLTWVITNMKRVTFFSETQCMHHRNVWNVLPSTVSFLKFSVNLNSIDCTAYLKCTVWCDFAF